MDEFDDLDALLDDAIDATVAPTPAGWGDPSKVAAGAGATAGGDDDGDMYGDDDIDL
jgi:hypothetical protein